MLGHVLSSFHSLGRIIFNGNRNKMEGSLNLIWSGTGGQVQIGSCGESNSKHKLSQLTINEQKKVNPSLRLAVPPTSDSQGPEGKYV